ncbi:hypothetical protein AB0F25_27985 [Streptomyces wedmorensis]
MLPDRRVRAKEPQEQHQGALALTARSGTSAFPSQPVEFCDQL